MKAPKDKRAVTGPYSADLKQDARDPGRSAIRDLAIDRAPLASNVAHHLREMIVQGALRPGERVQTSALAASLGLSITPIREALFILAEDQLVELLPNRGARVLAYTAEEALALFDVIAALEALAAERAATRMSEGDLAGLEAQHAEMAEHYARREKEPYFALNSGIHAAVLRFADNRELVVSHAKLNLRATRGRYAAILDAGRWRQAMGEHDDLMQAFRRRDADAAGSVWRIHLRRTGAAVGAALAG